VRTYEDLRKILALSVSEQAHAIVPSFEYNLRSRSSQFSIARLYQSGEFVNARGTCEAESFSFTIAYRKVLSG